MVLYLLTDGEAGIPYPSIKAFNDDNDIKKKIEFHAVGFGGHAHMEILNEIAKNMPNGKVSSALNLKDLTENLRKIVLGDINIKN
jgi:hypothetical protein